MSEIPDSVPEPVPGTPGIREMRSEMRSESFGFCTPQSGGGGGSEQGTRKVGLRAEIDTSPPFGSVKEAVTRFGGSGSWIPYNYRIGDGENCQGFEEIDIKKVEEQAAELEKDLIVKELETLDVLEELGTTKKIVEEFKLQLQKEALRCMTIPDENLLASVKEVNNENYKFHNSNCPRVGSLSPCPMSSPDLILMELKQAKLNLGKTINDLGVIQTSVESLNKKMKKEKTFLRKTRERLTSRFAGVLSLEEELKQAREKPQVAGNAETENKAEQLKKMTEVENIEVSKLMPANEQSRTILKTAELKLIAAKKMEEAAKAAEAVALAEINALSGKENLPGFVLQEPEKALSFEVRSPLAAKAPKSEGVFKKKVEMANPPKHEVNSTKMTILKKLREATEEVKQSRHALKEALSKVEMANRKQSAAEEALLKWMPEEEREEPAAYYATRFPNFHFHQPDDQQESPLHDLNDSNLGNDNSKPVLKSTISMRDVLSRKQVLAEDYVAARPTAGPVERQKVALSQMLDELREDLTFHPRTEKDGGDQKQFLTHRRKFGFIHISLPMARPSKKKVQDLNNVLH